MKRRILVVLLAILAFLVSCSTSMQSIRPINIRPINELVVFGDSLSDTGNVFRTTGGLYPPNPPYFQGRYSNGRVWVEYLAAKLKLDAAQIVNFAYGGATTGSNQIVGVPGLTAQVQSFTSLQKQANPDALYVIWAGANDYLQGVSDPNQPIANISSAVKELVEIGAKRLLIANLPDLGNLPATRNHTAVSMLHALTQCHNQALDKMLEQLHRQSGDKLQVIKLDTYSLYQQAANQPAHFGFTNVTGTCLSSQTSCKTPDKFLFWDEIHPTAAAHRYLGKTAFAAVKQMIDQRASKHSVS